jgi:hypothetical protein
MPKKENDSDSGYIRGSKIIKIVNAPDVSLKPDEPPGDLLLHFYRALGWNGNDLVDPCKIRTTEAVYNSLYDKMYERCPNAVSVGFFLVNSGPGVEANIPHGKVYLLEGWTKPDPEEAKNAA